MKVTFLGTGTSQGVPIIGCECSVCKSIDSRDKRLRTSALVQVEGKNILIDIGPDFREQMLRCGIFRLDAILITHSHRDHVAGIDDIRPFNYYQKGALNFYARSNAAACIRKDYKYIFDEHIYPGLPEVELMEVDEKETFRVANNEIEVQPIMVMHKDLPIHGYRIKDFTYITDANYISPSELDKVIGTKVLVINALRKEKHFSHYSLDEALEIVEKVKPQKAFLTHISHDMGFCEDVNSQLPSNVQLAHDGLTVEW
ncbi:MAG: MBL fold metallo-hydrolase [Bacteroidales bacterium]|nr:MBL fold metallo-hydrolase [Bacteroidales bacterium]